MHTIISFLALVTLLSPIDTLHVNRQQVYCTAKAVYHEARGESITGQSAVAHVVWNRKRSKRYPDTACEVVYQPHQFTNIQYAQPDYSSKAWKNAVEAAVFARLGIVDDPTGEALHYYAHGLVTPHWASAGVVTASIEGHTFVKID